MEQESPERLQQQNEVHIKFHMSTYHLADEDVIYPYVVHYQYKVKGETYNGKSQWFWFNPCIPKGTPIKILVDPKNPARSAVFKPESEDSLQSK